MSTGPEPRVYATLHRDFTRDDALALGRAMFDALRDFPRSVDLPSADDGPGGLMPDPPGPSALDR